MTPSSVDIGNCDREPIHIPGAVQSQGCLIVCDPMLETIRRHSVEAPAFLQIGERPLNGEPFVDLVGADLVHDLRNGLAKSGNPRRPALLFQRALAGSPLRFDISAHVHDGNALVEFEPAGAGEAGALEIARTLIGRTQSLNGLGQLLPMAPRLVRAVLGYDRVMIYRFAEDGSGQVIAEDKRADLESFSGQHFPASDIPAQARALYLKTTMRVIADARDAGVALIPAIDANGAALDLSFAHLRSVSPIHLEYLANMGVSASMSLSIVVNGEFWGLVACHHYAPKALTLAQRVAVEMFGEVFSLRVEAFERAASLAAATRAREALDRIVSQTSAERNVAAFLRKRLAVLQELVPSDGVGVYLDGEWSGFGATPPVDKISALAALVGEKAQGRVWSTHALPSEWPEAQSFASQAAGALAVPLSQLPRDYLFFFRRERIETLNWGGDPNKTYSTGPNGDRLTPRKSFEIWKQTVCGQSAHWSASDLQTAEAARAQLLEIMMRHSEVLMRERLESDIRQKTLNEELNHRVKNILALIKSLVSQDVTPGRDVGEYAAALKGRIVALANAHDQVVRSDGGGPLGGLARAELSPYGGGSREIWIDGPDIVLDARAYSVLALVVHELATNAAKYGALSVEGGRLDVGWAVTETGECRFHWRESGGPPLKATRRSGFGASLIRRSVPFDLGGRSEIDYAPDGLRAELTIPAAYFEDRSHPILAAPLVAQDETSLARPMQGLHVLLVEDQFVIALEAEALLIEGGAGRIGIAATLAEAEQMLARTRPDIAVLDVNLGRNDSLPVADRLTEMGVPFLFATGYGDGRMIADRFRAVPVVRKPYNVASLAAGFEAALRPQPAAE